ncbi:TPA: AlpA family phage regulatory protein [Klebsiella pneumoniae]|uniref:helix-turn-helix transcriptional regulator n=1 Tax=Klebsiella pneumoniae TaxID=573 RepID=UPI001E5F1C21|nr:AlpA family phage regulatory protein [Klebsiella pneumoniae]MCC4960071.1 AlpA family phage regulatory protein [Klebsiella pneumoniae]HBT1423794.1 AlpA family phage regulatory protein [Klebsiella pneumoniae]HDY8510761.1 AlpA family phage regulatory protein [Klebsiella pneumoniae]
MKKAFGRKELLMVVPLSMSTIDRLEHKGQFPKRFYITDGRCAWDGDEVEQWLDERKAANTGIFGGKKPPVDKRVSRPVSKAT